MSFNIGLQIAVAVIGLLAVAWTVRKMRGRESTAARGSLGRIPVGRGDFPWQWALGAWLFASVGYVWMNHDLLPAFPLWIIASYALFITPLNSYVSARMVGLTGQAVTFPFLNQAVVLGSHYTRPRHLVAPLPLNDYGPNAQKFREIELTGTKFTSIVKLEVVMLPLILLMSFIYWGFLWHTSEIPSSQFPYVQRFWPLQANYQAIWTQINAAGGASWATHALKLNYIWMGSLLGAVLYGVTLVFRWPLLFFYGLIGGIGNFPHNTIPTFLGALLGRYYFARRFGAERWQMYAPVILAGFACGVGLIGMAAIALALISKTVNYLPF